MHGKILTGSKQGYTYITSILKYMENFLKEMQEIIQWLPLEKENEEENWNGRETSLYGILLCTIWIFGIT